MKSFRSSSSDPARESSISMSYAETSKMLDLMLLVSGLDNRSEIEGLRDTIQRLDRRLDELVAR